MTQARFAHYVHVSQWLLSIAITYTSAQQLKRYLNRFKARVTLTVKTTKWVSCLQLLKHKSIWPTVCFMLKYLLTQTTICIRNKFSGKILSLQLKWLYYQKLISKLAVGFPDLYLCAWFFTWYSDQNGSLSSQQYHRDQYLVRYFFPITCLLLLMLCRQHWILLIVHLHFYQGNVRKCSFHLSSMTTIISS